MGDQRVKIQKEGSERRAYMRHLLDDLRALEEIINEGMIEEGVRRIGAEQEVFLVDANFRPASDALAVLDRVEDSRFTTELAQFNLEMNLHPLDFGGKCLSLMEEQLNELLGKARSAAEQVGVDVVLAGILPTLRKSDLGLENMTPKARYFALNEAMSAMRGGAYELYIKGLDELLLKHDSVMLESCNASFQVHFQVGAKEFPNLYNIAQVIAAPVLAAAVNSPILFGRQLWRETRIALFQQSVDTRSSMNFLRERSPRVTFGSSWIHTVVDLFREDISRFRSLVTGDVGSDSLAQLQDGEIPKLGALCLHNGTVYRWNRACYGITNGKPHLRIENRVLPSGPTSCDEIANAAFWFGLMAGLSSRYDDITQMMHFEDAKMNFRSAARQGLGAQYVWFNGESLPADRLICDHLLPLAHEGLTARKLDPADIEHYLGIIDERVRSRTTGADWITMSLADMRGHANATEQLTALTAAMVERQKTNLPVARWGRARLAEAGGWKHNFLKVEQYMTTDLFTVREDESLDLVASLMDWKKIRHVPVEDNEHRLVGLISYRSLLRLAAKGMLGKNQKEIMVTDKEVMASDPFTISPEASTLEAIEIMRRNKVSCLPVVKDERLVGIITERDLMNVAAALLEDQLKDQ